MTHAAREDHLTQRLAGDPRLAVRKSACSAWRAGAAACRRCAAACPAGLLSVDDNGPRISAHCLGCGRCAAACPTGAIEVQGFPAGQPLPAGNAVVNIECWKVPKSLAARDALRVPCLGGLRLSQVLEWVGMADGREPRFLDRGWCDGCSAGSAGLHPATAVLDEANRILDACAWPAMARPRLYREPLPTALRPSEIPLPPDQVNSSRRAFFLRLANPKNAAPVSQPELARRTRIRLKGSFPERERVLALASALAAVCGARLPAMLLPKLSASDSCRNHGVCASLCPTGALSACAEDGVSGLSFDAARCVSCGACIASCPESALSMAERGPDEQPDAIPERITRFPERICSRCLQPFTDSDPSDRCPRCRSSEALAGSLFGTVFAGTRR